jgi:hypothetical protein
MAAKFIYGVDGKVRIGSYIASYLDNWTMSINTGVAETPSMGSSGPVRTYSKYKDFSGSLSGSYRFDNATNATLAQESVTQMFVSGSTKMANVQARFVESANSMYFGDIVFTGVNKSQAADGVGSFSADWAQAAGPLHWSSDSST